MSCILLISFCGYQMLPVTTNACAQAVCLCLRNVLNQDIKFLKKFLSDSAGLRNALRLCKRLQKADDDFHLEVISFMAFICFFSDDILPVLQECPITIPVIEVLLRTTCTSTRMECSRLLSFLSVHEAVHKPMFKYNLPAIMIELVLECRNTAIQGAMASPRGAAGDPQGEAAIIATTLKFAINVLANLSLNNEAIVGMIVDDSKFVSVIFGILEEGERMPAFVQVKVATVLHNITDFKKGRQCIAGMRSSKDILRSQMSSTNKALREIISKVIADLRDERNEKVADVSQDDMLEKLSKRRERVMNELMHTERTYVDHLLQMVALFLRFKAISQEAKNKIDATNATKMHANVEGLSSLHFKFLQELEKLEKEKDTDSAKTLGGVLNEFLVGKLDIYKEYTQNFEKYQAITDEKAFRKFLDAERKAAAKMNKKRVEMTPQSLLITPIQRIPR